MKKFALAFCAIFALNLTVAAYSGIYTTVDEILGHVVDFGDGYVHIVGESLTISGRDQVLVRVGDIPVYDLLTGYRAGVHDISEGTSIRAAYVAEEPFEAMVVWLNWDYADAAVFSVTVSENIQYGDDYCIFLSADGRYRFALCSKTDVICPFYGQISPMDISPGQEFFVWVDMITASNPALVYPDKMVRLD